MKPTGIILILISALALSLSCSMVSAAVYVPGGLLESAMEFAHKGRVYHTYYNLSTGESYSMWIEQGTDEYDTRTTYAALNLETQLFWTLNSSMADEHSSAILTQYQVYPDRAIEWKRDCNVTSNVTATFQFGCMASVADRTLWMGGFIGAGGYFFALNTDTCKMEELSYTPLKLKGNCAVDHESSTVYFLAGEYSSPLKLYSYDMKDPLAKPAELMTLPMAASGSLPVLRIAEAPLGSGNAPDVYLLSTEWKSFDHTMWKLDFQDTKQALNQTWYHEIMTESGFWDFDVRYRTASTAFLIGRSALKEMSGYVIPDGRQTWFGPVLKDNITDGTYGRDIFNPF